MSTGSIEEKIIQRQLSKEGLQNIVDNREEVNQFSSSELKRLFARVEDSRSDTHDTLRCKRCSYAKTMDSLQPGEGGSNKHGAAALIPEQVTECASFVDSLAAFLRASAREG